MRTANAIVILLCGWSLVWHAVASQTRFRTVNRTPRRAKMLALSFAIAAVVNMAAIAAADIGVREVAVAAAGYSVSLGLFGWACAVNRQRPLTVAFSTDVPVHLVTTGPYRFLRHPFYAAYCLTWLSGFAASRNVVVLGVASVMVLQYMQAARAEEAKFAASPLADRYRAYRARIGSGL